MRTKLVRPVHRDQSGYRRQAPVALRKPGTFPYIGKQHIVPQLGQLKSDVAYQYAEGTFLQIFLVTLIAISLYPGILLFHSDIKGSGILGGRTILANDCTILQNLKIRRC
jgi:hypothetical protein